MSARRAAVGLSSLLCVLATNAAGDGGVAEKVASKAGQCRKDAATLRTQAAACRDAIAAGRTCAGVKIGADKHLAPDDAERLAVAFEVNAGKLDKALPGLQRLDDLVKSDQDGIRAIGFQTTVEQLEAWEKMGKARKCELWKSVIDVAVTEAFGGAAQSMKSLTPAQARDIAKRWRKVLKKVPRLKRAADEVGLFRLIDEVGKMSRADEQKLELVSSAVLLLKAKVMEQFACAESKPGWKDTEAWVNESADLIGSLVPDARARIAALGIRVANNGVHALGEGVLIATETERLTTLAEDQLRSLDRLTKLLRRHVDDRAKLIAKVAPCQLP